MKTFIKLIILNIVFLSGCVLATGQYHFTLQGGVGGQDLPTAAQDYDVLPRIYQNPYNQGDNGYWVWRIAGGYAVDMTSKFSLGYDLGYANLSNNTFQDIEMDNDISNMYTWTAKWRASYLDLLVTTKYKFTSHFSLLGDLGVAEIMQKVSWQLMQTQFPRVRSGPIENQLGAASTMTSKLAPEIAFGFAYQIFTHLDLSFTYHYIFADNIGFSESELSGITNSHKVATISNTFLGVNFLF
jgi:hypothetical protein